MYRWSGKVIFLYCAEERGRLLILRTRVVSEWCKHRDEPIAPVCQGKDAEFVEESGTVRGSGEQPFKAVLVDALREEGDDT